VFVDSHRPHPSQGGTPTVVGDPPDGPSRPSSQRVGPGPSSCWDELRSGGSDGQRTDPNPPVAGPHRGHIDPGRQGTTASLADSRPPDRPHSSAGIWFPCLPTRNVTSGRPRTARGNPQRGAHPRVPGVGPHLVCPAPGAHAPPPARRHTTPRHDLACPIPGRGRHRGPTRLVSAGPARTHPQCGLIRMRSRSKPAPRLGLRAARPLPHRPRPAGAGRPRTRLPGEISMSLDVKHEPRPF
jgi:hypothetical protein